MNNRPEIRFEGFNGEWEEQNFKGIIDLENGYAFKSEHFVDDVTKIIVLTPGNVKVGGGFQGGKGRYYNEKEILPDKVIFQPGDIFVTMTDLTPSAQSLGYAARVPNDGNKYLHNQRLGKIKNFKCDSEFLYQLISTDAYHKYIVSTASGTTVKHSSIQKILEYKSVLPSTIEEQSQIGLFFKQLDELIALQQQELDTLKQTKQGFLQKMFPKEGETVPEMRFEGFSGEWEELKLGELADIIGGGTPSTNIEEYWDGEIDWYSPIEIGKQIYVTGSQKKITALGLQKSSARILPIGTILFTSRAGIGKTAILEKEGSTNQGFQSIVPYENQLDSYFIFSISEKLKNYGEINGAGSTFVEVSGKQMAKMPISLPSIAEQSKIGLFFKQIDDTIALHQQELEALKETKQAFLQKMFV